MSQYEPNVAPGRSFIEKINSKFSNLSVSSTLHHTDKDGSSEDDTLIHKAFVNFYETNNQPFPEWLGVKESRRSNKSGKVEARNPPPNAYANSKFQPVRAEYNSRPAQNDESANRRTSVDTAHSAGSESEERGYTRRSNSRLQALYNKSRQQPVAGSGYSGQAQGQYSPSVSGSRAASSGQKARDRVIQGGNYGTDSSSRPSWGN